MRDDRRYRPGNRLNLRPVGCLVGCVMNRSLGYVQPVNQISRLIGRSDGQINRAGLVATVDQDIHMLVAQVARIDQDVVRIVRQHRMDKAALQWHEPTMQRNEPHVLIEEILLKYHLRVGVRLQVLPKHWLAIIRVGAAPHPCFVAIINHR